MTKSPQLSHSNHECDMGAVPLYYDRVWWFVITYKSYTANESNWANVLETRNGGKKEAKTMTTATATTTTATKTKEKWVHTWVRDRTTTTANIAPDNAVDYYYYEFTIRQYIMYLYIRLFHSTCSASASARTFRLENWQRCIETTTQQNEQTNGRMGLSASAHTPSLTLISSE